MQAEKMIQPRQRGKATRGAGAKKRMAATAAAHPVVAPDNGLSMLSADELLQMVEQELYFRAESLSLTGGYPEEDCYEVEAGIIRMLSGIDRSRRGD